MITLAAAGAVFALAGAAQAQSPTTRQPTTQPPAAAPQAPSTTQAPTATPTIKSVNVVDFNALPDATKTQVDTLVAKRSAEENQRLQSAIESAPMVKTAVEAKGFSSGDVLIAQMNPNGELTVITRKRG
jgi:hypothetical protein